MVQEREGTSDKTGVGRTQDDGTATVQSPGTSCRCTRHPRQPWQSAHHPLSARYLRPSRNEPCARATHGMVERMGWRDGTTCGGVGQQGLMHTETQRRRLWTARGRRCVDSENRQTTPTATRTTLVRQLLGPANVQTAPATTSTAPAHQPLGSANAETTAAGAPAAAAVKMQRPDATC